MVYYSEYVPMPLLTDRLDKWEKYSDTLSMQELERYEQATTRLRKLFHDKWNKEQTEQINENLSSRAKV